MSDTPKNSSKTWDEFSQAMKSTPDCLKCGVSPFLCDCPVTESKPDGVQVYPGSSAQNGGCTFCLEHLRDVHPVTVVRAGHNGGVTVRFCDDCLRTFRQATRPRKSRRG